MLSIRCYRTEDAPTLWALFYHTVRIINRRDYTESQVSAWAPSDFDLDVWQRKMDDIQPYVAEIEGQVVGYCDLQGDGLIDHFFCHHDYQGKGVGSKLIEKLIQVARQKRIKLLSADVSVTARPFFESKGFVVQEKQWVTRRGQGFTNFEMAQKI